MKKNLLIGLLLICLASVSLAAKPEKSLKKTPAAVPAAIGSDGCVPTRITSETVSIPGFMRKTNLSGSLRVRYTFNEAANQPDSFSLSRARIKLTADIAPNMLFLIQPDFAGLSTGGTVAMADAYVEMKFPALYLNNLKVGQFLVPFAYDSAKYKTIYGTGLNPTYYNTMVSARDYGMRVMGAVPYLTGFYYDGAIVNGAGTADTNKTKDLCGRLNYKNNFMDVCLSGYLGAAGTASAETSKKDIGLYVEWNNMPYQVIAEYVLGQNIAASAKVQDSYIQATCLVASFEPLVRYEIYDPNTAVTGNIVNTLIIGGSCQMNRDSKLVLNYNIVGEETTQINNNVLLLELQTLI
ncbi:MAG: porin [Candidatus Margulisbacteria bacterium]|nr:porin [Candidatus Margulisiibacteriota bacterium]